MRALLIIPKSESSNTLADDSLRRQRLLSHNNLLSLAGLGTGLWFTAPKGVPHLELSEIPPPRRLQSPHRVVVGNR